MLLINLCISVGGNRNAKKCESFGQLSEILGDGGEFQPNRNFQTVGQLVDELIEVGNSDAVYVRHDDHNGLKVDLPEDFLCSPLENIDEDRFESEIEAVLEQANIIIPLSQRQLNDDDIEEIREDRQYRGENTE